MKNSNNDVIYVGKANNLRNRIKQYYSNHDKRVIIPFLVEQVKSIETIVSNTEKEALILENNLIKRFQPKYNALLKDDKSYLCICINISHPWPMISLIRQKDKIQNKNYLYFGPFTDSLAAKKMLAFMRDIFPLRQCSDRDVKSQKKPCILYEMKQCLAPCVNLCSDKEYSVVVDNTIQFLKGKHTKILQNLQTSMEEAATNLNFEKAARIRDIIKYISISMEKQTIDYAGLEEVDAWGVYELADNISIMKISIRKEHVVNYNHFIIKHSIKEDNEVLSSFLLQYYENNSIPQEIITHLPLKNISDLISIISDYKGNNKTNITIAKIGTKKKLCNFAIENAKTHLLQAVNNTEYTESILLNMIQTFKLNNYPSCIDCIDSSCIGNTNPMGAIICYADGKFNKKQYKYFHIQSTNNQDDYASLKEILIRKYSKIKDSSKLPNLILIDGGYGHFNIAQKTLSDLSLTCIDIIAIAKDKGSHSKGLTQEYFFTKNITGKVSCSKNDSILFFLQNIRDEAHRFIINFQKKIRTQKLLSSDLDTIPGIGTKKKIILMKTFGSVQNIRQANEEQLSSIKELSKKDIASLKAFL